MTPRTGELELPEGVLGSDRLWSRARREVATNLPAWFYFFYGTLLLNTALTNFSPPRDETAWTAMFPLSVFVIFSLVRVFKAPDVESRLLLLVGSLGPALLLPVMIMAWHRPSPLQGKQMLTWYELSNFFWAGMMLWHAARAKRGHVGLFFGAGLIYGAMLENGGILIGFFHETNLKLTLIPPLLAPVATMVGWCVVLYMSTFVVWRLRTWLPTLRESNLLSAVLVAFGAMLLDLQIDPLATAAGCWVWDSSLPPFFHGVPLVNFVAWMCALTPFAWLQFRWQDKARIRDGGRWAMRDIWAMTIRAPYALGVAFILWGISMAALEGFAGPSWGIMYRFTGIVLALIGF